MINSHRVVEFALGIFLLLTPAFESAEVIRGMDK
jgi:hypothetical protein